MLLWSISSLFEYSLSPLLGANPERTQSEGRVEATACYNYTQKNKNKGATFEKKKWHKVALDNNNNNNRDETTIPFHFAPQFIVYKVNTMTDNYIRPTMTYELQ